MEKLNLVLNFEIYVLKLSFKGINMRLSDKNISMF